MKIFRIILLGLVSVVWAGVDPCSLTFSRIASRRFILDNELTLCTYNPQAALVPEVQYPTLTNGLRVVGSFCPVAHYRAHVTSLPAEIAFVDVSGKVMWRFEATGAEPPFDFSVLITGQHKPATFITKAGKTKLVGTPVVPDGLKVRLRENITKWKFCVGGGVSEASASLSAGIGQADVRFVTVGREGKVYFEGDRVFFTFSARGYGAYQAVASFNPSLFDVRLEGVVLFDYGDGELRNDLASHIFYDDQAGFWKGYASNFSTTSELLNHRAEGGVNAIWSERSPLHGISVMRAKSLGLTGMNEDPCGVWDKDAKLWYLFVSEFTNKGIRAAMLEAPEWDGPFKKMAGPVDKDSTGTTITRIGGMPYCLSGSSDRACYVYSYPQLKMRGKLKFDYPPWGKTCTNGRVWPALVEMPEGLPYRYLLLTMDRANFPGMPQPCWTYGGLYLYGAN